jgi:hypothetical protein
MTQVQKDNRLVPVLATLVNSFYERLKKCNQYCFTALQESRILQFATAGAIFMSAAVVGIYVLPFVAKYCQAQAMEMTGASK